MEYFIGFTIGGLLGLTGAGGSLFAVPLIVLFLGLKPADAMGVALGAVAVSAASGVLRQRNSVLWIPGLILATGGFIFAPLGKFTSTKVADSNLMIGFSVLAIAIAIKMWRDATLTPEAASVVRASASASIESPVLATCRFSQTGKFQLHFNCLSALIIGGIIIGFLSGLFGVGGGFLIVPYLLFLGERSMAVAVATSLFVIMIISASGFISHLLVSETIIFSVQIKIIIAGVVGMLASQTLSKKVAGPRLQKLFATLLVLISAITLLSNV